MLTQGGLIPGPDIARGHLGSASITFGSLPAVAASVDIYGFNVSPNELTFEALLAGSVVAHDTISMNGFPSGPLEWHQVLSISGPTFDSLRLVASGPEQLAWPSSPSTTCR